jgi:hypothetical protein
MHIAAVAFIRGLVFRRLDARRSPLFAHCQRRYGTQPLKRGPAVHPPDPKDAEDAVKS